MIALGQIPGADEAIRSAATEGWVTVLFVVIVLATFTTFGYVIRQVLREANAREERLSNRLTQLEDFIRVDLVSSLRENSVVMQKMLAAAEAICLAADSMSDAIAHCRLTANHQATPRSKPNGGDPD